jgi:hypothetical protein
MPEGAKDVVPNSVDDVFGKDGSEGDPGKAGDPDGGAGEPAELTGSETEDQIAAHFKSLVGKPMTEARAEQLTRLSKEARHSKAVRERVEGLEAEVKSLRGAAEEVARNLDASEDNVDHAAKLRELGPEKYLGWVTGGDEEEDAGSPGDLQLDPSDPRDKLLLDLQAEKEARGKAAKQAQVDSAEREAVDGFAADMDSALKALNTGSEARDDLVSRVATTLFLDAASESKDGDLKIGPFVTKANELLGELGAGKPRDKGSTEAASVEVVSRERETPKDDDDDEDNEAERSLVAELNARDG